MNAITPIDTGAKVESALSLILDRQRAAFLRDGPLRSPRGAAISMKLKNAHPRPPGGVRQQRSTPISATGHAQETLLLDIGSVVGTINYLHRNLAPLHAARARAAWRWCSFPARTASSISRSASSASSSPWNYPVSLALAPACHRDRRRQPRHAQAVRIHAGNDGAARAMLAELFDEDQVAVVTGDAKVGSAFSEPPLRPSPLHRQHPGRPPRHARGERESGAGHARARRQVARHRRARLLVADRARRIAYGKLANGGQTCVAPDYALVPEEEVEDFVAAFKAEADKLYPDIAANPDYTWIVNDHHFARLTGLVDDAEPKVRA